MHQPGDDLVRVREDHHQGLQGSSAARRRELAEPGHQPQRVRVRSSVARAGSQAGQELVQQHSAKDAQGASQAGQGSGSVGQDLVDVVLLRGSTEGRGGHSDRPRGGDDRRHRVRDEAILLRQHAQRYGQPQEGSR